MAVDFRTIRSRVRGRLKLTDLRNPVFDTVEIDEEIASQCLAIGADLPPLTVYQASGLTISANSNTFRLPTTVTGYTGNDGVAEYRGGVRIQLVSTGRFLVEVSNAQLDSYLNGSGSIPYNRPEQFALYTEKGTGDVEGRTWPGASSAEACNLYLDIAADDVRDYVGSGSDDMDDVQVQFPRTAALALELRVAADLLLRMKEPTINPAVAEKWAAESRGLLYKASESLHNLEDPGRIERWES